MDNLILDLKEVMERVQDDKELLFELIDIFIEDCVPKLEGIRKAASEENYEEIKDIAHSLKGSSSNLAAKKIYASFLQIEEMGKSQDVSQIDSVLAQVELQIEELKSHFEELKKELA